MKLSNIIYFFQNLLQSTSYCTQLTFDLLSKYFWRMSFQNITFAHKVQQQMLLFGGKMKAIKDYDYDLNYILYQYRSLTKRKAIKPFLTLIRGPKDNKQQFDHQCTQNNNLTTPLSFSGKQIDNRQTADRFYNKQHIESQDLDYFKKFLYQHNADFFSQQISEMANKFQLFQVEQQENISNVGSQCQQQSYQAQNTDKMLFELSQNQNMLSSRKVQKKEGEQFKYLMKRAINNQNLKLQLENHVKILSEVKQKEANQFNGTWSDLRSEENTTQSQRKLKNNESSPQSKQTDDGYQIIESKQKCFQNDTNIQRDKESSYESIQKSGNQNRKKVQIDLINQVGCYNNCQEYKPQFYVMSPQKDKQVKDLQSIRQSQNEIYQTQLMYSGFSSKKKNIKQKIIQKIKSKDLYLNQDSLESKKLSIFYQLKQSQVQRSVSQSQNIEKFEPIKLNLLQSNNSNSVEQHSEDDFKLNEYKNTEINAQIQDNDYFPINLQPFTSNSMSYTNTFRPNSFFLAKNQDKKVTSQSNHLHKDSEKQMYATNQLQIMNKEMNIKTCNNHSQEIIELALSASKNKKNGIINKQYGKNCRNSPVIIGASYINSFKKQKQKEIKQKAQKPKTKNNNMGVKKMNIKNNQKISKQQSIKFQINSIKECNEQQQNLQLNIRDQQIYYHEQDQIIIRSQPLTRQSNNQDMIKSTSYLSTQRKFIQQHAANDGKQTSNIKVKSISGIKSEQEYNLLKLMGGGEHLKELSSLVIQQKDSGFQIQKQQLAHFMAANSISVKSETFNEQSEDISFNSQTYRFTPNNLTSFNLKDALEEDSKSVNFNQLSQKQRKQLQKRGKTQQYIAESSNTILNEETDSYSPLFVNYKKFNNNIGQLEMAVIEELQSNKIMSSSSSHAQSQLKTIHDYKNHFNPKRALSRMKQQRGKSQIKQNPLKYSRQYQSLSPSRRVQGALQGIKKRWEKNALRFKTKMHNF